MVIEACGSRAPMRSDKEDTSDVMQYYARTACLLLSYLTTCPRVMYDVKAKWFNLGPDLLKRIPSIEAVSP